MFYLHRQIALNNIATHHLLSRSIYKGTVYMFMMNMNWVVNNWILFYFILNNIANSMYVIAIFHKCGDFFGSICLGTFFTKFEPEIYIVNINSYSFIRCHLMKRGLNKLLEISESYFFWRSTIFTTRQEPTPSLKHNINTTQQLTHPITAPHRPTNNSKGLSLQDHANQSDKRSLFEFGWPS